MQPSPSGQLFTVFAGKISALIEGSRQRARVQQANAPVWGGSLKWRRAKPGQNRRTPQMASTVHIVDTTHANAGELVAITSSVGELADGYRFDARPVADINRPNSVNRLRAHIAEVDGGFG